MSWAAVATIAPAVISAGGSIAGGMMGGDDDNTPQFARYPEYEESTDARKQWWETLQNWGSDPNYGAISPNWSDIWTSAQRKVQDYFGGTATSTGAFDKVKASAARRGVSDSPALESEMAKMGVEQGGMLANMATEQATQQASFGENARNNWMNSLQSLAGLKPQAQAYTPASKGSAGEMVASISGSMGNALGDYGQMNWLEQYLKKAK